MRRKRPLFLVPLIVVLVITAFLGAILLWLEISDRADKPVEDTEKTVDADTTPLPLFESDLGEYEKYMDVRDKKYLILVNKENPIDAAFQPESLVRVKDARKEIELEETAQKALEAMFTEMRAHGFEDVFVTSAYRSYTYQNSLFNTYINDEMSKGLSYQEAKERVLSYSAYPGTSEHHTGLCVDLMTTSMKELDESFAQEAVYPWLVENAWKFGFILRYPEDKTEITGYSYEPWHYRFVGRYHAYKITSEGLCFEEYLQKYGE